VQEREVLLREKQQLGPAVLFFGCRHRNHDYIYESELTGAVEASALSKLHVAFSRMGASKDYVQHHMEAQAGEGLGLFVVCRLGGYLGFPRDLAYPYRPSWGFSRGLR
jgi:NADPH-ferrihemoprotein reductase